MVETLITLIIIIIAWVFFRTDNIAHAMSFISKIFSNSLFSIPDFRGRSNALIVLLLVMIFFIIEWFGREHQYAIDHLGLKWKRPLRWAMYYGLILVVLYFAGKQHEFVYFQF
jgi:alginate O-acetyltransferase complex protein AlgI